MPTIVGNNDMQLQETTMEQQEKLIYSGKTFVQLQIFNKVNKNSNDTINKHISQNPTAY